MKWGVRRFQTEDGSLTNAGRKRYSGDGPVGLPTGYTTKHTPVKIKKPIGTKTDGVDNNPKHKTDYDVIKDTAKVASKIGSKIKETASKAANSDLANTAKEKVSNIGHTEVAKRGKAAIDVLMNGDSDWMGRHNYSNDVGTEIKNRGKAAVERLLYSQEQIDNKKFFGRYDF